MKIFEKRIFLQQIGMRLRRLRVNHYKTNKAIAAHLNITPQAYGNIERGESDMCITRLIFLASYYEISVLELIPEEYRSFENPQIGNSVKWQNILQEEMAN